MEIVECNIQDKSALDSLKAIAWKAADKEHYGDNQPNFFRKECTLIAKDINDIIGYITLIVDSGVVQIEPLMVNPEMKGRGIGTQLLQVAEEKAKALGVHKIWLETGADWEAKQFYEKHGYVVRTILPNHTGGKDFVLMDKMI